MSRAREAWLSAGILLLAVPAHLIGLLVPSIYRDPAVVLPQNLGTDVVTLGVVIPLLAGAAIVQRTGSARARIVWLGALGYLVYAYGMYALGVRWNELFLVYVALFGLSLFTLIVGLVGTDAHALRAEITLPPPARSAAAYLMGIALLVGALWLAEEVRASFSGVVPPSVLQFEAPTNIVHVFDLGVVLPAFVVAAVMLLKDRPWGYVLAGMLLVKAATIGLWVVVMIWLGARAGLAAPAAYIALFVGLTLFGAGLTWRYLYAFEPRPRGARTLIAETRS